MIAHGGLMGATGSVSYLFNPVGRLVFAPGTDAGNWPRCRCARVRRT